VIFTTGIFAAFLIASLLIYWLLPGGMRKPFLSLAGMVFYAYYFPLYLLLVLALTAITYLIALQILKLRAGAPVLRARYYMMAGAALPLLTLGYFKYYKMLADTVDAAARALDWGIELPHPDILVPLAISFFTFEFVHFIADVYLRKIAPETINFRDYLVFIFFFPTLISGPIKRYQSFQEQAAAMPRFQLDNILEGCRRMIIGLAKKFIVADTAAYMAARLANPDLVSTPALVIAAYAYSINIFFDFAGYSDIAIGVSRMFGFRVPENFDHPYLQQNISQFWRRWHMSLTSWIKDYVYIPLGGSRRGYTRTLCNLVITFALCGLWHGGNWNFVAWGLWHGLGMVAHRLWNTYCGRYFQPPSPVLRGALRGLGVLMTFHFVTAGWILFASPSLSVALQTYAKIGGKILQLF
jgi:alginate O-acetyltransferase complex protein AlgI